MSNETKAVIGWSCERRGYFELFENDPATHCCPSIHLPCGGHRQREVCDATPGIFIPATEARPFIKRAKSIAGLVPACTAEEIATQEEFINRCDEYLAMLPEEEK